MINVCEDVRCLLFAHILAAITQPSLMRCETSRPSFLTMRFGFQRMVRAECRLEILAMIAWTPMPMVPSNDGDQTGIKEPLPRSHIDYPDGPLAGCRPP